MFRNLVLVSLLSLSALNAENLRESTDENVPSCGSCFPADMEDIAFKETKKSAERAFKVLVSSINLPAQETLEKITDVDETNPFL